MAIINFETLETYKNKLNITGFAVKWPGMVDGDVGEAVEAPGNMVRTIQSEGVFGATPAVVRIQGRIGNATSGAGFTTLKDLNGTAMSQASANIASVQDLVSEIRPAVDGSASAIIDVFGLFMIPR